MRETGRTLVHAQNGEPLTRTLAKEHLREDSDEQDTVIDNLITVSREWVEAGTWRALMPQTFDFFFDRFPAGGCAFEIPLAPLRSITSISYIDSAGVAQTLVAGTDYTVDTSSEPGRVRAAYGKTWPTVRDETMQAVTVRAAVGYASAAAVPRKYVQAMLLLIGHWYANRESVLTGTISSELQQAVEALLDADHMREMIA